MIATDTKNLFVCVRDWKTLLSSLKIYATHLFMPTELHSGHVGPSMVLLFTCGETEIIFVRFSRRNYGYWDSRWTNAA